MRKKEYAIIRRNGEKFFVAGLWDALDALAFIDDLCADDAPLFAKKNGLHTSVNLYESPHIVFSYIGNTKFGRMTYNIKNKTMQKEGYIPPRYKAEIQKGLDDFLRSIG